MREYLYMLADRLIFAVPATMVVCYFTILPSFTAIPVLP